MRQKKLAILGSTGSIGSQTLDIVRSYREKFVAEVLVANNNADLLIKQAIEFQPNSVVIVNEEKYKHVCKALSLYPVKVYAGARSVEQIVCGSNIDIVVAAIVGYAGLKPVVEAVKSKKTIALANKETLVVAGDLIMKLSEQYNSPIIPVDSEHSAIFQCLVGEPNAIDKILLTASGGPFLNASKDFIERATIENALNHPKWDMGAKITIDSATLMNKGFEVIEARWLFDVKPEQIQVLIHPQSVIHSMVQFVDGSIKAQLGQPDMHIPISYALNFPVRLPLKGDRVDFSKIMNLEFKLPDTKKFPCLQFAYDALEKGGNAACIINAANEIAVQAFLNNKINIPQISRTIEKTMEKATFVANPTMNDYAESNNEARNIAEKIILNKI